MSIFPLVAVDPVLFTILTLALLGAITWMSNRSLAEEYTELILPARVGNLRVEQRRIPRDAKMRGGAIQVCYATFRYGGLEQEHRVTRQLFRSLQVGDQGWVKVQGAWFQGFSADLHRLSGAAPARATEPAAIPHMHAAD